MAVEVAERICAAAEPGQGAVTEAVADLAGRAVADLMRPAGGVRVAELRRIVPVFAVGPARPRRPTPATRRLSSPTIRRCYAPAFASSSTPSPTCESWGRRADRPRGWPISSARELDVLRLIARGRSKAENAAELILGEDTIKTRVSRVFSELGLRDRAQAVVVAYETGLVVPEPENL